MSRPHTVTVCCCPVRQPFQHHGPMKHMASRHTFTVQTIVQEAMRSSHNMTSIEAVNT
jgi:hypothetical protein